MWFYGIEDITNPDNVDDDFVDYSEHHSNKLFFFIITLVILFVSLLLFVLVVKFWVIDQSDFSNDIQAYGYIDTNGTIYVTSAEYFDKCGYLDNGSSKEYNAICNAMRAIGASENSESKFTMKNDATPATVAVMLKEQNVTISFDNKAFNEFCER